MSAETGPGGGGPLAGRVDRGRIENQGVKRWEFATREIRASASGAFRLAAIAIQPENAQ